MKYGLSEKQLQEIKDILSSYDQIKQAILFGSRAIDTYKEASDVDIAIKGEKADWSLAMTIKDHLEEETYLPFFFDVVAYGSVESKELKKHIDTKGKVLVNRGMSEWREYQLEEIAQLEKNNWKVGQESQPYIALEHIVEGGLRLQGLGDSSTIASNKYRFNSDTFLFGKLRPYFRKLYRPSFSGICSTDIWVVKPKDDNNKDFLFYFFANQEFIDLSYSGSSGTRMPRADWKFITEQQWKFPEPLEQKAIAEVLSSLDDKIDLLHRQNKTLEQMAETLFRQWFVEEAQEDWEEGVLGDVAINVRNSVKVSDIQGDVKYVGLEHIDRRNISLNQYGFGNDVNSNKSAFEEKDILFGKLRPYFHKVCIASFSGICSTDILVIRPKAPEYLNFCLFAFFQDDVVEYANLGSGGTRMPRTNWDTLKQYPITIPDENTIARFNDKIEPTNDKIINNIKQIRTLESLRDTLLPKLMSGEIRVAL